jgi:DNA-binding LytR/AlgR family response regulator
MLTCQQCGAAIASDWRFCRRCGSPLGLINREDITTRPLESRPDVSANRRGSTAPARALKTFIIDDEASARSRLRKLLASHSQIEIIGEAGDGLEAVAKIESLRPDLIFLDVQMPGLNGFEVLRALPAKAPLPLVIFATAYDEYALAAFEANAVGYLLKPINRERLNQAVERAHRLFLSESQAADERERIRQVVNAAAPPFEQIVARKRDRFVLVPLEEVFFFCVEDGLVKAKTETGLYRTDYQITELEARLPDPPFFVARRSVIVNLRKVKEIAPFFKSTYQLIMNDPEATEIQVSERQSKRLREMLESWK